MGSSRVASDAFQDVAACRAFQQELRATLKVPALQHAAQGTLAMLVTHLLLQSRCEHLEGTKCKHSMHVVE